MTALNRIAAFFVAPAEDGTVAFAAPAAGWAAPAPARVVASVAARPVAVLAPPSDLDVAAGAVAGRMRGAVVLVATWGGGRAAPPRLPAVPAARRLAAHAAVAGLAPVAAGRLVRIALPADAREAAVTVGRLAALGKPLVVAAARREEGLDPVLAEAGELHVAAAEDAPAALAEIALAQARTLNPSAGALAVPRGPAARLAARHGWGR